jgi:hypothetical protein
MAGLLKLWCVLTALYSGIVDALLTKIKNKIKHKKRTGLVIFVIAFFV